MIDGPITAARQKSVDLVTSACMISSLWGQLKNAFLFFATACSFLLGGGTRSIYSTEASTVHGTVRYTYMCENFLFFYFLFFKQVPLASVFIRHLHGRRSNLMVVPVMIVDPADLFLNYVSAA